MADNTIKKNIEIAIKVKGDVGANLKAFQTSFQTIATAFDTIKASLGGMDKIAGDVGTAVNQFVSSVGDIKLPPKFNEFVTSLSQLNSIKAPNLDNFAKGLSALHTVSAPDSKRMKDIADSLKEFNTIKVPSGLNDLAKGIAGLAAITKDSNEPVVKAANAISTLVPPLRELGTIKLPNLKNISEGLAGLKGVNVSSKAAQFLSLSTSLKLLDGIKLPNLKNIADGLKGLVGVNVSSKAAQFASLSTSLRLLDGIKLPNLASLVNSVEKLGLLKIDPSFPSKLTQLYYALKSFEDLKSAPSFSSLTSSVKKLGDLKIPVDLPKTLNYLASELRQFSELKSPPNLNALLKSINAASAIRFDPALPKTLNYLASEMRQFSELKSPPNLDALLKSLKATAEFKIPVDLPKTLNYLANEMRQFSELKSPPNLNTLLKSIKEFSAFTIPADLHTKLGGLAESFKQFNKVRVPNLSALIKSVEGMKDIKIPADLDNKLKGIADSFGAFKGIRIPTLKGLSDSLEKFKDVKIDPNLGPVFKELALALGPLQGVKVPALGAMVKGMEAMVKMDLDAFTRRVLEVSAALNKLDENGRLQSFKGFAEALKAVEAKLGRVGIAVDNTHQRISRFGFAFASATAGLSSFNRNLYGMARGLSAINTGIASLTGFTAFFGSLYAIKDVSAYLIEFDDAIRKAGTTSQASSAQIEELARAARLVGEATRYTATDAAMALQELTQAGLSVNEAIGALPGVMQLAASAALDIKEAAHISTNIMYGYGMSVEDLTFRMDEMGGVAGSVNDILTAAFNRSNTDLTQLGVAFKYAGPVAKSAGIQFEETASILASLAQAGYQGSTAGTTLRRSIANLLSPTKQMQEVMDSYGLSVKKSDGQLRSMLDILDDMRNQGITTGDALEIFGKRAGTGMAALLQMGNIELQNMMANMESAAGIARRNAIDMEAGIGGTWRRLVSQWEELKLALGSKIESNIVELLETVTKTLNENKEAIVDSIGTILDWVSLAIKWGSELATIVANNAGLTLSLALLVGGIKQAIAIYGLFTAARAANLKLAKEEILVNGVATTATTAKGMVLAKLTMILTDLKAAFAFATVWAGRFFKVLSVAAMNPYVQAFMVVAAAIGGIMLAADPAEASLQELIKTQTESIKSSQAQAEKYRETAASLRLLLQDYKAYEQEQRKAGIVPGQKQYKASSKDIDELSRGSGESFIPKAGVRAAEEIAFAKALERVTTVIPGAIVKYNELGHAYLDIRGKAYETRKEIEDLIEQMNERAANADVQTVAAAFAKEALLVKEQTRLQEEYNKALIEKKKLEDYAAIYKGAVNDRSYINRFEQLNELNDKLKENGDELVKNRKIVEDSAVSYLNSGYTVDQFAEKMVKVGNISKENVSYALAIATSYEVATKRIDVAYDKINKKYSKQLTALRSQLQEETKEYDEAVKELEMDLKEGLKAFDEFKGAADKIADIEFGDIDTTASVKSAQKTLDAVNRVYTEDTSRRRTLVVNAENELNKAKSDEALKGLNRSLAMIDEFRGKTEALAMRQLDNEYALIKDSHRKVEQLQRRKNEVTRNLDVETAAAKVKVTEKALSAIESAYNASLKQEVALKTRLDSLLRTSEDLANTITKAMGDSVRDALTPVGQYYDKLREIDELENNAAALAGVGEHEKALELLKQAMSVRATMGGAVLDDGIEMISQLETQATQTKGHVKSLELVRELEGKIKKELEDKIKLQEKETDALDASAKSLSQNVVDLKDALNQGVKVEIKIDLAQAQESLDAFTAKQSMVLNIQANMKEITDAINELNGFIRKETSAALVDAVKTMDEDSRATFFNINKAYKRIYEKSTLGEGGDTIVIEKQKKEVEALKNTLNSYLIVEKDVLKVKKALAEADAGRPEKLRSIIDALGKESEAIERADKFNTSSITTKQEGIKTEEDYTKVLWQSAKTEQEAAQAKQTGVSVIVDGNKQINSATQESIVVTKQLNDTIGQSTEKTKELHEAEKVAISDYNKGKTESIRLSKEEYDQKLKEINAKIAAEEGNYAKLPESSAKSRDIDLEGKEKKLQGKIIDAVRDAHLKEEELTEKLKEDLKALDVQYARDEIQRKKDVADKKLDIEGDLKDKLAKIGRQLKDDLKKIDKDRTLDQKKAANDILSLYDKNADRIREIDDRKKSDRAKQASIETAAYAKAAKARRILEEGLEKGDSATIERGKTLLDQASDMLGSLNDQAKAKKGILALEEDQVKAINYGEQVAFIEKQRDAKIAADIKEREARIATADQVKELEIKNTQDIAKAQEKLKGDKEDVTQKILDARDALWRVASDKIVKYREKEYLVEIQNIQNAHISRLNSAAITHDVQMRYLLEQRRQLEINKNIGLASSGDAAAVAAADKEIDRLTGGKPVSEKPNIEPLKDKVKDKSAGSGVIKDSTGKILASTETTESVISFKSQGIDTIKSEIASIVPSAPYVIPVQVAETRGIETDTAARIGRMSDELANIGTDEKGIQVIGPEQQEEVDRFVSKVRNSFSTLGVSDGVQGVQDMVTTLNGVAQNTAVSRDELVDMFFQAKGAASELGLTLVEDVDKGISTFSLLDKASGKVTDEILKASKEITGNPIMPFDNESHEAIVKSLKYIEGADKAINKASKTSDDFDKSIDNVTKSSKTMSRVLDKGFDSAVKDATKFNVTLEDIPKTAEDTTEQFKTLEEETTGAFAAGTEGAEDLQKETEKIDMEQLSEDATDAADSMKSFAQISNEPLKIDTDGISDVEKEAADLASAVTDIPDVDIKADINTTGEEEVKAADKAIEGIKDKEVTVTINVVKRGDTSLLDGDRAAEVDGGEAPKFAKGGYTGFKKLTSPFITQGSGGKEDDVPALLQKGEFVQKRAAVNKYGVKFMADLNAGRIDKRKLPMFNTGGMVGTVDSIVQKFASGGIVLSSSINKMKRKLEEDFGIKQSSVANNMNFSLNNTIVNAGQNMQTTSGVSGLSALKTVFTDSIARFAEGGSTSGASSVLALRSELNKKYEVDIAKAKAYGDDKLVAILRKEQDDLNAVAVKLAEELKQLELEYQEFKKTTQEEHLNRVKEITDTYNEVEDKAAGTDLDTEYAKELQELRASYKEDIDGITEDDTEDKISYDEAMADYAKETAELIKEFESNKVNAQLEQDTAALEANRIGLNIAKALTLIREAEPAIVKEVSARNKVNTTIKDASGRVVKSPDRVNPLLKTFDWEALITDKKDTAVGWNTYVPQGTETPDFAVITSLVDTINQTGAFKDVSAYTAAKLAVESLKSDYATKDMVELQRLHDEEIAQINADAEKETTEYNKTKEESAKDRIKTTTEFNEEEATLTKDYTLEKTKAKDTYTKDLAEENKSFDTSMLDAAKQYYEDIKSAKESAGSEFTGIKDTAKSDYESEKASIAEALKETKEAISTITGKVTSNVDAVIRGANKIQIPPDFWKKLRRGIVGYNTGGRIPFGNGAVPGKDSVVASLTPGEYVMREPVVRMFGENFFNSLNAFKLPKFNMGGIVDSMPGSSFTNISSMVRHSLDLSINGAHHGILEGSATTIESLLNDLNLAKMRT